MAAVERGTEAASGSHEDNCAAAGISLLLVRFSDAVDGRRPDDVARLFTSDGLFQPGQEPIRGQPAIERFYTERLHEPPAPDAPRLG